MHMLGVCGGDVVAVVGETGVVTSPGYPQQYTPGLDCLWTIKVIICK